MKSLNDHPVVVTIVVIAALVTIIGFSLRDIITSLVSSQLATSAELPLRECGEIVASETFADSSSLTEWMADETSSGENANVFWQDGQLHLIITETGLSSYLVSDFPNGLDDGCVEVEVQLFNDAANTGDNLTYKLAFRFSDIGGYYFGLSPYSGSYGVLKYVGRGELQEWDSNTSGRLQQRSAYRQANARYRLRAEMRGDQTMVFIDDILLGKADTSHFRKGQFGVAVSTGKGVTGHVVFDNFVVRRLR